MFPCARLPGLPADRQIPPSAAERVGLVDQRSAAALAGAGWAEGQAAVALEVASGECRQGGFQPPVLLVEFGRAVVVRIDLGRVAAKVAVGGGAALGGELAELAQGERVDAELVEPGRGGFWAPAPGLPVDQLDAVGGAEDRVDAAAQD